MDKTPETLYSSLPPTQLRNRDEPFREGKNNPFWHWVGDLFFFNMLENRFYSLMYANSENFEGRDKRFATIFYAPHCNWWDGIVGYNMIRRVFNLNLRMMVEEMNRFPLFSQVGAFPVNKKSPQTVMRSVKFAVDALEKPDIGFWLFPEGIIKPPNHRPFEFQTGLAYMAKKCAQKYGGINIIPVSVNYTFLREDKPEVLVDIGKAVTICDPKINREELTKNLEKEFEAFCNNQLAIIHQGDLKGYQYLSKQKLKWFKKLEKRLKRVDNIRSGV